MRTLEEERTRALDAAARARTEVAELAESRRKLQWQSKLLEKMSEVRGSRARAVPAVLRSACAPSPVVHTTCWHEIPVLPAIQAYTLCSPLALEGTDLLCTVPLRAAGAAQAQQAQERGHPAAAQRGPGGRLRRGRGGGGAVGRGPGLAGRRVKGDR